MELHVEVFGFRNKLEKHHVDFRTVLVIVKLDKLTTVQLYNLSANIRMTWYACDTVKWIL